MKALIIIGILFAVIIMIGISAVLSLIVIIGPFLAGFGLGYIAEEFPKLMENPVKYKLIIRNICILCGLSCLAIVQGYFIKVSVIMFAMNCICFLIGFFFEDL